MAVVYLEELIGYRSVVCNPCDGGKSINMGAGGVEIKDVADLEIAAIRVANVLAKSFSPRPIGGERRRHRKTMTEYFSHPSLYL